MPASRIKPNPVKWIAVYYREARDDLQDPLPARGFLSGCPTSVRAALSATIVAVKDRPPPSFPASSPMWSVMHKPRRQGDVDMSGIFEARDKHQNLLYRLFCLLDSDVARSGLEAPALVMLSGTIKRVGEEVPQPVYAEVRRQADRYFATIPRPVVEHP
jgi:hypothetical protein